MKAVSLMPHQALGAAVPKQVAPGKNTATMRRYPMVRAMAPQHHMAPPNLEAAIGHPRTELVQQLKAKATPAWLSVSEFPPGLLSDIKEVVTEQKGGAQNESGMVRIEYDGISIECKPVEVDVPSDPGELQVELDRAMAEKAADDSVYRADWEKVINPATGQPTQSLIELAQVKGYYESGPHIAWSIAAEARTGGAIPAAWWRHFDPFGGTAGAGPRVLPQGEWPGTLSRIAMGHDTDWSLGRYFGAGPMAALRGAEGSPDALGLVGLAPQKPGTRFSNVELYTFGHSEWVVRRVK